MVVNITNRTGLLTVNIDGVEQNFTKRNVRIQRNSEWFRIDDYDSNVAEFDFASVQTPVTANAIALRTQLRTWLQ